MRSVERGPALLMADAATLLLDAAREAAKQSPNYKAGHTNERDQLTIAIQALFIAEFDLRNYGGLKAVDGKRFLDRLEGMSLGLGAIIGACPDQTLTLQNIELSQKAILRGLLERMEFNRERER